MSDVGCPLRDFRDPPVIETLLGVQFVPLETLSVLHFGLFWARVRERYPRYQIQPPLDPAVEEFDLSPKTRQLQLRTFKEPSIRCWFITEDGSQLVQLQKDRLIRNWRKRSPEENYPRYASLKPEFVFDWERFSNFLEEIELGVPEINQCEVTYVNHIVLEKGWQSFGETQKAITLLSEAQMEFLPRPEFIEMNAGYAMPNKKGRLRVSMQPVFSAPLQREVLQLTLTARGKPTSSNLESVLEWFNLGHEWIVRGFVDLTTPEMHRAWGRI